MIESLINSNTLEVDDRHNDPHSDYKAKKGDNLCPPRHEIHRTSRITQVGPVQTKVQKSHASKAGANKLYGEVSDIVSTARMILLKPTLAVGLCGANLFLASGLCVCKKLLKDQPDTA
jgi:hypothetical protein